MVASLCSRAFSGASDCMNGRRALAGRSRNNRPITPHFTQRNVARYFLDRPKFGKSFRNKVFDNRILLFQNFVKIVSYPESFISNLKFLKQGKLLKYVQV